MSSDIIDIRGKKLKSKFRQDLEAQRWIPMMGMCMCMACKKRWMMLFPAKVNLFRLQCPKCKEQDSWVNLVPREYEQNFIATPNHGQDAEPPKPPPAA